MDEALKAKAHEEFEAEHGVKVARPIFDKLFEEAPVATQSKYEVIKSWFVLHPKVKTAAIALFGVTFAAFDQAYNSNHDYTQAGKIAGAAAAVWIFAYLKSA